MTDAYRPVWADSDQRFREGMRPGSPMLPWRRVPAEIGPEPETATALRQAPMGAPAANAMTALNYIGELGGAATGKAVQALGWGDGSEGFGLDPMMREPTFAVDSVGGVAALGSSRVPAALGGLKSAQVPAGALTAGGGKSRMMQDAVDQMPHLRKFNTDQLTTSERRSERAYRGYAESGQEAAMQNQRIERSLQEGFPDKGGELLNTLGENEALVDFSVLRGTKMMPGKSIDDVEVGQEFVVPRAWSTTVSPEVASRFAKGQKKKVMGIPVERDSNQRVELGIDVSKGQRGVIANSPRRDTYNEAEVTLAPGRYQVTGIDRSGGRPRVRLSYRSIFEEPIGPEAARVPRPFYSKTDGKRMIGGALAREANRDSGPIRAYHGSPHDFDRFDMSKIGTGEGAQAYGHGLYLAEERKVAESYKNRLAGRRMGNSASDGFEGLTIDGRPLGESYDLDPAYVDEWISTLQIGGQRALKQEMARRLDGWRRHFESGDYPFPDYAKDKIRAYEGVLAEMEAGAEIRLPGRLYEVDIHASSDDLLDWDVPFGEQSPQVQEGMRAAFGNLPSNARVGGINIDKPREVHTRLLSEEGVKGIRYLDQASRGMGEGTRNYVIFDDKILEIVRKYGISAALGAGLITDDQARALEAQNEGPGPRRTDDQRSERKQAPIDPGAYRRMSDEEYRKRMRKAFSPKQDEGYKPAWRQ